MRLPVELRPAPARWSLRNRPPFLEAYPLLSVGDAYRAAHQGYDHLIWRDRRDNIAGMARAVWIEREALVIHYAVDESPYYEPGSGELTLSVVWKGSQENNARPFAPCPLCGRDVDVFVYLQGWSCARHGLRHRSAQLGQEVRWSERLAELDGLIAADRAVGATGRKHEKRLGERAALLAKLRDRPVTANALQLEIMTGEWVRPVAVRKRA